MRSCLVLSYYAYLRDVMYHKLCSEEKNYLMDPTLSFPRGQSSGL